jgi:hypothetical protein
VKTYVGIDWGTHSSKWVARQGAAAPIVGQIWDSGVSTSGEYLLLFPLERRFDDPTKEISLKRKLIQDPDQSFWEGTRPKLGVTLGEAVVFSLLALLLDAKRSVERRGKRFDDLEVRFSHPNWIDESNVNALACFRDAAVVALRLFMEGSIKSADAAAIKIPIQQLRQGIDLERRTLNLEPFPGLYVHREFEACTRGLVQQCEWSLVFESCAAGFPYLVQAELDIFEEEITKLDANRQKRKILVVDVGAGSTDAGYLVRTVRSRDQNKIMKPLLIWLPAANALEIAGRWLTDRILADLKQQGRRVTATEAEDFKVAQPGSWGGKSYVQEWSAKIADHVADYVEVIKDEICLANSPPLEVVITGGSSAVTTMRNHVLAGTQAALQRRGLSQAFSERTKLLSASTLASTLQGYDDVRMAQLAVALGASDPYLSQLKAYPNGLVAIATIGVGM